MTWYENEGNVVMGLLAESTTGDDLDLDILPVV